MPLDYEPTVADRRSLARRAWEFIRRWRWWAVGVLVVLLASGAGFAEWRFRSIERQERMAHARAAADAAKQIWTRCLNKDLVEVQSDETYDTMCRWSERWYRAEAEAAPSAAGRRTALDRHLARLDELDDRLRHVLDGYVRTDRLRQVVRYYRARALAGIED